MRKRRFWSWACALAFLLAALPAANAWAAIPAVVGPVQALIAILPQLMALLGAACVAMLKPDTYKVLVKYLWTHKVFSIGFAGFIWLCVWGCGKVFSGGVGEEQVGAAWSAFRGGPERLGAVTNAQGPQVAAKVAWKYQENNLERVDSSPCVVGNRVYASTGTLRLIGDSTGSIYCRDAEKGGEVWAWTGKDFADEDLKEAWDKAGRKLKPIFSSPAVGGEFANLPKEKDGSFQQGRYLVVGEGYHTDWNSRILCLDLEPVKTGKSDVPKLKWFKQTTCHVESSPCILGGKVYIGAADDGIWCIDMETGETRWRLEGSPAFYVTEACGKAADLEKLVGKYVKATGTVERQGATVTEPGEAKLAVKGFEEVDKSYRLAPEELNLDKGRTFERWVVGKVTLVEKPPMITLDNKSQPLPGISKICIVPDEVVVDVESSPVAARLSEAQASKSAAKVTDPADLDPKRPELDRIQVFVGSGVGGEAVVAVDGVTGKLLWTTAKTQEKFGFPVFGSPTVVDGKVVVGMGNGDIINDDRNPKGEVRCMSAATGELAWRFEARNTFLGAVPVYQDPSGNALAYACSRDKNLYVLDVNNGGRLVKKVWIGSPMVCSPAVTNDAIYLTTNGGKVVCVDRRNNSIRWSFPMCPGQEIISSPAVAGGRLFVGSVSKGLFCLVNNPAGAVKKAAQPWAGSGGTAGRGGLADDLGLPGISGQKALRKWVTYKLCRMDGEGNVESSRTMAGPVAVCGQAMYLLLHAEDAADEKPYLARVNLVNGRQEWMKDLGGAASAISADEARVYALVGAAGEPQKLVCLDAADGKAVWGQPPAFADGVLTLGSTGLLVAPASGGLRCLTKDGSGTVWDRPLGQVVGSPAADWNLIFVNVGGESPKLLCLDDVRGEAIWSVALPARPVGPPAAVATADGGRVFAACAAPEAEKGVMLGVQLVDGRELWQKEIPGLPVQYPVASDDVVVVAGAKGLLYAYASADGRFLGWDESRQAIPELQAPALAQTAVVFAGTKRLSAWNATSAEWPWYYKDQGVIGRILAPPVVARETVYIVTEKRGLVAVAPPPPPDIFDVEPAEGGEPLASARPVIKFSLREDVNGLDPASVQVDVIRKAEKKEGEKEARDEKLDSPIVAGAFAFDCPEMGIAKGKPVGAVQEGVTKVVVVPAAPLPAGTYEVKIAAASVAGARAEKIWKFTVKEGAGK